MQTDTESKSIDVSASGPSKKVKCALLLAPVVMFLLVPLYPGADILTNLMMRLFFSYLFPLGLVALLPGLPEIGGPGRIILILAGWLFYFGTASWAIRTRRANVFFALYALFLIVFLANVAGCQAHPVEI